MTACDQPPPRPAATLAVSCCGECPFVREPEDDAGRWKCAAADNHQDTRALADPDFHAWRKKPPRWCPLRKADQLIQLETEKS